MRTGWVENFQGYGCEVDLKGTRQNLSRGWRGHRGNHGTEDNLSRPEAGGAACEGVLITSPSRSNDTLRKTALLSRLDRENAEQTWTMGRHWCSPGEGGWCSQVQSTKNKGWQGGFYKLLYSVTVSPTWALSFSWTPSVQVAPAKWLERRAGKKREEGGGWILKKRETDSSPLKIKFGVP